jgi:hypothetical protein
LVVIEVVLMTATCLVIIPSAIVLLALVLIEGDRADLPVARLLRKRKTGRRFQRPVYQRVG